MSGMTCCSDSVCACSPLPRGSATSARPVGAMGVNRSTYYRLKARADRYGLEALRVRERRRPRMPNELGPHLEQRILAFALAQPGLGPRRISAELRREKWGGPRILRARRLARPQAATGRTRARAGRARRGPRRALRAPPADPAPRAHTSTRSGRRARRRGLLLPRAPPGHEGRRLAVHGDRRQVGLCLGAVARIAEEPQGAPLQGARPGRGVGARPSGLAARARDL